MTGQHQTTHVTAHQDKQGDWVPHLVTGAGEYRIGGFVFDTEPAFIYWATRHLKDLPITTLDPPEDITPEQLTEYLTNNPHWIPEGTSRGATSWRPLHPTKPTHILVPPTHQYQDDPELVTEALHTIAKTEGRHPNNLHHKIVNDRYMRPGILRYR